MTGTTVRLMTRPAIAIGMALRVPNRSPRTAGPTKGTRWRGSCQSSQRAGADLHVESHPVEQKDHTVETNDADAQGDY